MFLDEWGIDQDIQQGGLLKEPPVDPQEGRREVSLMISLFISLGVLVTKKRW